MGSESAENVSSSESFAESILGKNYWRSIDTRLSAFFRGDPSWRVGALAALFATLVFVPYLGAVGLWDPWETHYGEVGRMMIARNDYVYPYWESAWFFSKTPWTMWLTALGMQIVGTNRTGGAVSIYTEWGMRLPIAILCIVAVALLAVALTRAVNKRVGLASAFILCTMPLFFLITRQAVTDTPFIATMIAAMACALIGQFDDKTAHRAAWWYAFYIFCGASMLSKGLLGFGIPAVVLLLYAIFSVIPWDEKSLEEHISWVFSRTIRADVRAGKRPMPVLWAQFYQMRLGTGILVFLAVTVPWFAVLFSFDGLDDEGKVFWYRFLIHDHLGRLTSGVHSTTTGGFTYFIEQGGFAIFPWVALVPGAMSVISRLRLRSGDTRDRIAVIATLWAVFSFLLMGSSATKFHHYVLPMLPGLAILIALFIDDLWEQGIARNAGALIVGFPLFALVGKDLSSNPKNFTDLFVYNYDRPYPFDLVQRPLTVFGTVWTTGHVYAFALILIGLYLVFDGFFRPKGTTYSRATAIGMSGAGVGLAIGLAFAPSSFSAIGFAGVGLAAAVPYLVLVSAKPGEDKGTIAFLMFGLGITALVLVLLGWSSTTSPLVLDALRQPLNIKLAMAFAFTMAGAILVVAAMAKARVMLFGVFWALACGFALWFNWDHWVDLSQHWTQRDQFKLYYEERNPDEPIVAFMMNWRGETFYSKNTVKQIRDSTSRLHQYANLPGRKWALVEHNRFPILRNAVGPEKTVSIVDKELNNKFMLVTIE